MDLATSARLALLASLAALSACAAGPQCPAGQTCGGARWESSAEGLSVVAVSEVGGVPGVAPGVVSDALPLSASPVYLRFDLTQVFSHGRVARAVLSFVPHAAWHPRGEPVRISVAMATGAWDSASVAAGGGPDLADVIDNVVTLPAGTRVPVRIDVTAAVQRMESLGRPVAGLGVVADSDGVVFAGAGALQPEDRPRLEVALR